MTEAQSATDATPAQAAGSEALSGPKKGRAIGAFIAAMLLGSYLVSFNIWQPWSPTVVVGAYALFLYYNRHRTPLTGEIKDSTYYLGFSLNLIFLVVAFRGYGLATDESAVRYLVQSLGSAIIATVAGLIARYILYVADDDDELVQRQVFSELQEEIRKSASGFRQNQKLLSQTITAFLNTRRQLASKEEQASREYVEKLTEVLAAIRVLHSDHVAELEGAVRSIGPATEQSLVSVRQINQELVSLRQSLVSVDLRSTLSDVNASMTSVNSAAKDTAGSFDSLAKAAENARLRLSLAADAAPALREDLQALDAVLTDFIDLLGKRVDMIR